MSTISPLSAAQSLQPSINTPLKPAVHPAANAGPQDTVTLSAAAKASQNAKANDAASGDPDHDGH